MDNKTLIYVYSIDIEVRSTELTPKPTDYFLTPDSHYY